MNIQTKKKILDFLYFYFSQKQNGRDNIYLLKYEMKKKEGLANNLV